MEAVQVILPVIMPTSSYDNQMMRFHETTGKVIQVAPLTHLTDNGWMMLGSENAPRSHLELWDDSAHPILTITAAHATDYDPQIQFRTDVTDTVKCSLGTDSGDSDKFKIYMGAGIGGTSQFVFTSAGYLAIGNASPQAYLHVGPGGDAPATGGVSLYVSNNGQTSMAIRDSTNNIEAAMYTGGGYGFVGTKTAHPFDIFSSNSRKIRCMPGGNIGFNEADPETLLEMTHASPYQTFHCSTESDAADSGMCKLLFKREQSNGTESTHAAIYAAHDGSSADQNGYIALYTNDGTDGDSPTERMRIDSQGYFGLGISPSYLFHLYNQVASEFRLELDRNINTGAIWTLQQSKRGVAGVAEDILGQIQFFGRDSSANNPESFCHLRGVIDDPASGGEDGRLEFATKKNGSLAARMVIKSGNVGIGVTDPDTPLEIFSTSTQFKLSYDATNYATIATGANGDTTITTVDADGAAGHINFVPDGNVGFGVASPTSYVHIKAGTATAGTAPIKLTDGTLLGTPEAGTFEYAGNKFYITNVECQQAIDRTSCVETSTASVSNTTNETTIYTCSCPANSFRVGNHVHIELSGIISNNSASDDITINLYVGSTLINTYNPAIGNVTNEGWHVVLHVTIRTIGATGTMASHGHVEIAGNEDTANELDSIDTTAANDITIKVQWDNAKVDNIISLYQGAAHWRN